MLVIFLSMTAIINGVICDDNTWVWWAVNEAFHTTNGDRMYDLHFDLRETYP